MMRASQQSSTHMCMNAVLHSTLYEIMPTQFSDQNSHVPFCIPSNLPAVQPLMSRDFFSKCTGKSACWAGSKYSKARIWGLSSVASHRVTAFVPYCTQSSARRIGQSSWKGKAEHKTRAEGYFYAV